MRRARIESLAQHGVAVDTETWRIQPGSLCPPLVCGSVGWLGPGPRLEGALLDKESTLQAFARLLDDPNAVLIVANGAFDFGVLATELAKRGVDAMPWLFRAFEDGRVFDIQVAEALHAIAMGHLGADPRTGGKLKNPETGKPGSYSLSMCVDLVLGRKDAKANDEWRLNYHMLDGVPIDKWPAAARDYPVDDVRNTLETCLAQAGHLPNTSHAHHWVNDANGKPICVQCGATRSSSTCVNRVPRLNLHQVADQTYSAFALHLGAAHGFRVDQSAVDVIERYYTRKRECLIAPFVKGGLIREDGSEDQSAVKRLMAVAYGATEPCPHCQGTGKIPSPKQKPIRCPDCRGYCLPTAKDGPKCREWRTSHPSGCTTCSNTGLVPHPNPKMITCCLPAHGDGDEEDAQKTCDGTGLVLVPRLPRTDTGCVGIGRDPLVESGDEYLMSYGYFKEDQKILGSYVPYLRHARVPANGHTEGCPRAAKDSEDCTCDGPWIDIPLTLKPNPMLETGRVSYQGVIQLLPRAPGFVDRDTREYIPSLRECIVPRGPRYQIVEVSATYELQSGETLYV